MKVPHPFGTNVLKIAVFEDCIISCKADIVWLSCSCGLTSLDYYLWSVVRDKYYGDKPETTGALEDTTREAIGEIKMHTIYNVLKNWTDRVGYCMVSRGSQLKEIIFHY